MLKEAIKNVGGPPAVVVSDGYRGYATAINKTLRRYGIVHLVDVAFGLNALLERVNREVKKRLRWFKCNVSKALVEAVLGLWFHAYHHKFHCGLGCTPVEAAQASISTKV